jgi:hypothetical protein
MSPKIDRRRFLISATTVTAAGLGPGSAPKLSSAFHDLTRRHVFSRQYPAGVVKCLKRIGRRNALRRYANLPLLSVPKELGQMMDTEEEQEFRRFEAAHRQAAWDRVLEPRRKSEGSPNWRPTSFAQGMGYQSEVNRVLRQEFRNARDGGHAQQTLFVLIRQQKA